MNEFFVITAIAFAISYCITPLIIAVAKRYRLVDDAKRVHPARTHSGVVPRAGGLALYIGIITTLILFVPMTKQLIGIIAGASIILIVGLLDDRKDVNPYVRVLTNILAALCVVAGGISIAYVNNPFTGEVFHLDTWRISFDFFGQHSIVPLANLLAILWIVWTMNIVGWSSGVDGQLPGFIVIAAATLGLLSLRFLSEDPSQATGIQISSAIAGSYLGFLPWNFYPQKIMPGYSGKALGGFLLATLSILAQAKIGTAFLVLGVPMIDAFYTLIRRTLQKKSPVWPDRGHLHQRLMEMGWGKKRIAIFYWLVSAILGLIALSVTSRGKLFTVFVLAMWIAGIIAWARLLQVLGEGNVSRKK